MVKAKNKAITPRLAFPFCLKTAEKKGSFQKKQNCAFTIMELQQSFQKLFQDVSKALLKPVLEFVDFWVQVDANQHSKECRNMTKLTH